MFSVSSSSRFIHGKRAPSTHFIGGPEGPIACLDSVVKRRILGSVVQPRAVLLTSVITGANQYSLQRMCRCEFKCRMRLEYDKPVHFSHLSTWGFPLNDRESEVWYESCASYRGKFVDQWRSVSLVTRSFLRLICQFGKYFNWRRVHLINQKGKKSHLQDTWRTT